MGNPSRQSALAFPHAPPFTAAEFMPTQGNSLARAWLARTSFWPAGRLALWGEPGAGKTHLLHVWAIERGGALIPGATLRGLQWPDGPVAIDDIDLAPDETALLNVVNAAAEAGCPLLLASRTPPARLPVRLPDLASRLRATTAIEISPAGDAFLPILLARLLSDRQLVVPPALQAWLLARLPRTPGAIRDAADRLDHAALAAGRGVTRALAAATLGDLFCDSPAADPADISPAGPGLV